MDNFQNAEMIGSWFNKTGYHYCADDNTYTPYTYAQQAWACETALSCPLTCAAYLNQDLFLAMFS
jgi:hypothetical protein